MPNTKAKTIQILLYDGTLNGVINIADSAWSPGEMYVSPRDAVNELVSLDKYGVYLLLSNERVYVGQAQDLSRRIKQHLSGKGWWERVVLLTTQDDSFTRTDIDYLESVLIGKAEKTQSLDSDNKNKGQNPKINKFRKVDLDQYLDEVLFLMELIGVSVFSNAKKKAVSKKKEQVITISQPEDVPEASSEKVPESSSHEKPPLPDESLKAGEYVRTAMLNLQNSGFLFSEEQIALFSSVEGSKPYTGLNLPMFLLLNENETRSTFPDQDKVKRYWKDEFQFGEYRFLMFSQWYPDGTRRSATKKEFIEWYNLL